VATGGVKGGKRFVGLPGGLPAGSTGLRRVLPPRRWVEGATQKDLIITKIYQPKITVDNPEVAQSIYLLLNKERIRDVIDTTTAKVVLILGRFTPERKAVLDAPRDELRRRDYLPILFDFDVPASRDITETVPLLARMAWFVVADITDARSIPQELGAIVPDLPSVPVRPSLPEGSDEYSVFEHFRRYPWVLPMHVYASPEWLIAELGERVVAPAEANTRELRALPPAGQAIRTRIRLGRAAAPAREHRPKPREEGRHRETLLLPVAVATELIGASAAADADLVTGRGLVARSADAEHHWEFTARKDLAGVSGRLELVIGQGADKGELRGSIACVGADAATGTAGLAARVERSTTPLAPVGSFPSGRSSTGARRRGCRRTSPPIWSPSPIPPSRPATAASDCCCPSPRSSGAARASARSFPERASGRQGSGTLPERPPLIRTSLAARRAKHGWSRSDMSWRSPGMTHGDPTRPRPASGSVSRADRAAASEQDVLLLLARVALGALFVLSGLGKLADLAGFAAGLQRVGVPFAAALAPVGAAVELLGGLALALGAWTRPAALLVAGFTVVATLLAHHFWAAPAGQQAAQTVQFLKNLAIVGGLLAVAAAGAGRFGVDGLGRDLGQRPRS
jgi:uncharacterized membrane protein YphA (DoxX/SURF4 family)